MKKSMTATVCVWCALAAAALCAAGGALAGEPKQPAAGPGWVVIEEDVYYDISDEPSASLEKAHENFLRKDYKAAAGELRKASAFIKMESARATAEGKKALDTSYSQLRKLAADVESGAVMSVQSLETASAGAHKALAAHYTLKAAEAQSKKDAKKAADFMGAAARNIEQGFSRTGQKLDDTETAALKDIRSLSGKLATGVRSAPGEVGKSIAWLGKETEKIGQKLDVKK